MEDAVTRFADLGRQAEAAWATTFSLGDAEPLFLQMLNLAREHSERRQDIVLEMDRMVDTGYAPWEAVQFCMRDLQWPEVKELVEAKVRASNDPRVGAALQGILDVYETNWDDADLYGYYRTSETGER